MRVEAVLLWEYHIE